MADVYFNVRKLKGKAHKEYVAFVDIMGTRTHMKKSVYESANFIFKLHAAIISAWREKNYHGVFVYPVMDGAYITARNKDDMINIMLRIYRELAKLFVKEQTQEHQYMIRGAIAYGEVIHGHDIFATKSSGEFPKGKRHKRNPSFISLAFLFCFDIIYGITFNLGQKKAGNLFRFPA